MPISSLLTETLRTSAVLVLTLGLVACLARRSAATRHWVLLASFVAAWTLPTLSFVAPAWGPTWEQMRTAEVAWRQSWTPLRAELGFDPRPPTLDTEPPSSAARPAQAIARSRPVPSGSPPIVAGLTSTITALWLTGLAVGGLGLLTGLWRLRRLSATAQPVSSARLCHLRTEVARNLGVRRPVRLLTTSARADVLTWGWLRPRVVLPRDAETWTDERLRVVLGHELAHVRRGDWASQLIAEGLGVLQWFNPVVWVACRRLRDESEQACDDIVLAQGFPPETYAAHLVALARSAHETRRPLPAPAVARPPSLERRIVAMLRTTSNRHLPSRVARSVTGVGVAMMAVLVAGFGLAAQSASVSGTVVDPAGHAIPGASVRFFHRATQEAQSFVADERGHYVGEGLAPGTYSIRVTRPGFSRQFRRVELDSGESREESFALELGRLEETIVVTFTGEETVPRPVTANRPRPPRRAAPGQQILPPIKIRDLAPRYPESARETGFEAKVMIDAMVTSEGFIDIRQILVPVDPETMVPVNADIARAAADAVRQWQYEPTRLHDVPVDTGMDISVTFRSE